MHFLLLLSLSARAGTSTETFDSDAGAWTGGALRDGALVVHDGIAALALGEPATLSGSLLLRQVDAGRATVRLGDAAWSIDYAGDDGIALGEDAIPLPHGHRRLQTQDAPILTPGDEYWDGGNTLHCEVHYDEATATWFLYWTGEMAEGYPYRQIGVATSTDGETWERYEGNPVLTIDYGAGVEGVHVHFPTVVVDGGQWNMYYSCYQNNVGNRICRATSTDGLSWERQGVVLDRGEEGTFDSGSLRQPDVLIEDGTWHMLYNGTDPEEHYGPTGYATSTDGATWEKHGAITTDKNTLQGGSMLRTAYGVEQWYNCADAFCWGLADPSDLSTWTVDETPVLSKGWQGWNDGYIQAPSTWLVGTTVHMWFNAYSYTTGQEVLAHAWTVPDPGASYTLELDWDGAALRARMDEGPWLETGLSTASALQVEAEGEVEVLQVDLAWEESVVEDGGSEDGGAEDGGAADGGAEDGGAEDGGSEDGAAEDGGAQDGGTADGGANGSDDGATDGDKGGCGGRALLLGPLLLVAPRRRRRTTAD